MRLVFMYTPVKNLEEALAFYRDELGWKEGWREGDTTASLEIPGSDVQVMLDIDDGSGWEPGPVFAVDSVPDLYRDRSDLRFRFDPVDIPGGKWGAFDDPSGNPVYVVDAE